MPQNNLIKNLLDIKDKNITITGEEIKRFKTKGITSKFIEADLSYIPKNCEKCQSINHDFTVIANGWMKPSMVLINEAARWKMYLKLRKRRFICKKCHHTFVGKSPLIDEHCFISTKVKQAIAVDLQDKISITDIAKKNRVSTTTAYRVFDKFYQLKKAEFNYLPQVLLFDEFKSVKGVASALSFIFMDGETHDIIDIVQDRKLDALMNYFLQYDREARKAVRFICIDMYAPYRTLIKKVFPNAKIIIDRFHIIQHISRSLNMTRVRIMNQFKGGSNEDQKKYRRLKNNWKLLLKAEDELNYTEYKWNPSFRKVITQKAMVDEMLSFSGELEYHYRIYQDFIWAIRNKDTEEFQAVIDNRYTELNGRFTTTLKTFKKFRNEIINALEHPYSNGPLEATNNKIKVIKRISYGFRSFINFKKRILVCQKILKPVA